MYFTYSKEFFKSRMGSPGMECKPKQTMLCVLHRTDKHGIRGKTFVFHGGSYFLARELTKWLYGR